MLVAQSIRGQTSGDVNPQGTRPPKVLESVEPEYPAAVKSASPASSIPPRAKSEPSRPTEVVVSGTSEAQRVRRSAQAVKVVEFSEARKHTADTGEVLARTEGVAVQRSGGLGSSSRLSLHGLVDDQIRVTLDGVPLEVAGFGLGISTVPLSWVERIEVYRGVVPLRLGADALGGAVDVVTERERPRSEVEASYTIGSFGTQQVDGAARTYDTRTGFFTRAAGFYDYARNNYRVNVRVPDELGRLHPATVERFHDSYRAGGGFVEAGFIDRSWAKRLLLRVFATDFDKDLQHNVDMSVPYGAVKYGQSAAGGTLRFEQPNVGASPFGTSVQLTYATRILSFEDTSRWVYDWFGNRVFERAEGSGEIRAFASSIVQWESNAQGRAAFDYALTTTQKLRLVVAPTFTWRSGEERLRTQPDRIDPLTTRRRVLRVVSGLEHEYTSAGDRIQNSLFAKHYYYRPVSDQVVTANNAVQRIENTSSLFGIGDAFRAELSERVLGKVSYEYATRLPRTDEVFGDGALISPNLALTPETSHNANASISLERSISPGLGKLACESGVFWRQTANMIVRLLAQDRVHAIHQNVFDVRTLGVDGSMEWRLPRRWLTLRLNGTWQDQRNASSEGPFTAFEGQRVPNRPWLFANASAAVRIPSVGWRRTMLTLALASSYIHEFLPGWAETTAANDPKRIPTQLTHTASVGYSVTGTWSADFVLDVSNIADARVYDALGAQLPGRAVFFKTTLAWHDLEE